MDNTTEIPQYEFINSENWLTRKPSQNASITILLQVFFIILGSYSQWNDFFGLRQLMPASSSSLFFQHEYWRAWTSLLVHSDFKHLGGNLFLFSILGYFLSGYFSLFFFPITAFVIGGLTNFIVLSRLPDSSTLIGLSGVVYWMGGAWLSLYFFIENRKSLFHKVLRSLGVALLIFMPSEAFDPSISYESHFFGFVFGIISGSIYYLLKKSQFRSADVRVLVLKETHLTLSKEFNSEETNFKS